MVRFQLTEWLSQPVFPDIKTDCRNSGHISRPNPSSCENSLCEVTCINLRFSIFNVHEGRNGFGLWKVEKSPPKPRSSAFLLEPRSKNHVTG